MQFIPAYHMVHGLFWIFSWGANGLTTWEVFWITASRSWILRNSYSNITSIVHGLFWIFSWGANGLTTWDVFCSQKLQADHEYCVTLIQISPDALVHMINVYRKFYSEAIMYANEISVEYCYCEFLDWEIFVQAIGFEKTYTLWK